jgi:hypothetical protein
MEAAAREKNPAEHGYAEKRRRVFEYVEDIFSDYLRRHNDACNATEALRELAAAQEVANRETLSAAYWKDKAEAAQRDAERWRDRLGAMLDHHLEAELVGSIRTHDLVFAHAQRPDERAERIGPERDRVSEIEAEDVLPHAVLR